MTSPSIQRQFAIDSPTSGVLLEKMIRRTGAQLDVRHVIQGRVEGEVAFVMGRDVNSAHPTAEETLAAVARAFPAIEVVNCRIVNWDVTPSDFVADNAAAAFVVLGDTELELQALDLSQVHMEMRINEAVEARGVGSNCLGSPLLALHWLALHLLARGQSLQKGDLVMSGSLGPALPIKAGDAVQVRLDELPPVCVEFC